ncbi:GNAT family N-acetyltransferase [Streptosporangium sp. NPDC001681]|uniref:GNAT family N-acetyltransferase n=1 Tax=Streptosporangium sp. NPDC001681 TaxID=3154395 RepID=UPI00332AFCF5
MRETWPYRPELDLVAVSPGGDVVAYCQGWYDEVNGVGAFEPVGTHPGHRRLGLARAVCTAVMHAFFDAGGHRASSTLAETPATPSPNGSTSPWASPRTPALTPMSGDRRPERRPRIGP